MEQMCSNSNSGISSPCGLCDDFRVQIILNPRINLERLFRKRDSKTLLVPFIKKRELDVINGVQSVTTKRGRRE